MAGHILRLPDHRAAKVAISSTPADGRRKTGRPKKTWRRTFQQDLQMVDFKWEEVLQLTIQNDTKLLSDVPKGTGGIKSI